MATFQINPTCLRCPHFISCHFSDQPGVVVQVGRPEPEHDGGRDEGEDRVQEEEGSQGRKLKKKTFFASAQNKLVRLVLRSNFGRI
jgi:hypothetical protein